MNCSSTQNDTLIYTYLFLFYCVDPFFLWVYISSVIYIRSSHANGHPHPSVTVQGAVGQTALCVMPSPQLAAKVTADVITSRANRCSSHPLTFHTTKNPLCFYSVSVLVIKQPFFSGAFQNQVVFSTPSIYNGIKIIDYNVIWKTRTGDGLMIFFTYTWFFSICSSRFYMGIMIKALFLNRLSKQPLKTHFFLKRR